MWLGSLPVQVAMYERAPLGGVTWLGVAVWAVRFGFETVGDAQLRRFRADPANAGRVLDRGPWRYRGEPKEFGDVGGVVRALAADLIERPEVPG